MYYSGISPYPFGDFLINYHYGFVRRGLIGTVFIEISKLIKCNLYILVNYFMGFTYLLVFGFLIKNTWNSKLILFYFVTSPFGFLFILNDWSAFGYKDILLLFLFIVLIKKNDIENGKYRLLIQTSIIVLGVLIHENFLFLSLPFIFLLKDFENYSKKKSTIYLSNLYSWISEYLYLLLLGLILGLSIYLSTYFTDSILIDSLREEFSTIYAKVANTKYNSVLSYSSLDWLSKDLVYGINKTSINYSDPSFVKLAILHTSLLAFYVFSMTYNLSNIRNIYLGILRYRFSLFAILLGYGFIFFIATDWGRWMHLFFMHFSAVIIIKKNKNFNFETISSKYVLLFSLISIFISFYIVIPHVYYFKNDSSFSIFMQLFKRFNFEL